MRSLSRNDDVPSNFCDSFFPWLLARCCCYRPYLLWKTFEYFRKRLREKIADKTYAHAQSHTVRPGGEVKREVDARPVYTVKTDGFDRFFMDAVFASIFGCCLSTKMLL